VHDLLKHLDPRFAAQVRVVATTDVVPMPPFVATAPLTGSEIALLRQAFAASIAAPELGAERETLLLKDFAFSEPEEYDVFRSIVHTAEQYADIW
jgi:ABC-type phosphate/phosphonate transport system substrate-binding protein